MNQQSEMSEKTKKQKKASISEEDVSTILQRYAATTVLALLQEVAQNQGPKIDWNALVKRSKTGITNPREYQMLWRHLAYRDALLEKFEDDAKPLDDDSDLECELEAFPPVSNESSMEAAACVKVLIASGATCESSLEKGLTVEAPLTINIPAGKAAGTPSENPQLGGFTRGTNITVPVSVQKQPLPTVTYTEGTDTNGAAGGSLPPRRKRKPWSEAEDMELFAAVQKCGEGNWANILKGDFKSERTASQLSQRWNIIKKRGGSSNTKTGSQLSEVHLAARRAINMALDQPRLDNLKTISSLSRTKSCITPSTSVHPVAANTPSGPRKDSLANHLESVKAAAGAHLATHVKTSVIGATKTTTARPHLEPMERLKQNGTPSETNGLPKEVKEGQTQVDILSHENGNHEKAEASRLNENVLENAGLAIKEPVMMKICENGSKKTNP